MLIRVKKSILPLLFTSALLAACTNNDFEQIQTPNEVENGLLKGRAKGEIVLNAEKSNEDQASTRVVGDMDGDAINWMWENAQDKLGAVVVDYADNNEIVDLDSYPTYAITNYPFAPDIQGPSASAEFSTPTAVVSGAYMFYNRYDGKATQRRTISHSIERILKVDAGKEIGLSQVGTAENGGQNFFISPIVDLAIADGENIAKPISMTSTYSVLHFKLQSDTKDYYEKGFKVNKIVLKAMDGEFQRNLTIDPTEVATIQKKIAKENPAYATYFRANGAIDAMNLSDEQIGEALRLVNAEIANPNNSIGENKENATSKDLVYQLNEPFVFKNKDQVLDLMVIVPSATYNNAKGGADETYEGVSEGVFLVTVYTSEGIYNTYVAAEKDKTTRTLMRGKKYNIPRTMIIDGGRTNVTLFDQAKGFDIETTEDYEYAIEYINDHYRDYGDGNEWTIPALRFVDGKEIEVDAEHFFPNFPVLYKGNAKLVLVGQKDYVLDPTTAIFATGNDRPTIVIKDDAASLSFKGNVCAGIKDFYGKAGQDGVNVTCAYKVVSDAAININAEQKVDFSLLESNTAMTIGKKAVVTATTAETNGILSVAEGAKLTVDGAYTNGGEVSIAKDAKVILKGAATNEKDASIEVAVRGELASTAKFVNDGTLTLNGATQSMNIGDRSKATFKDLENGGKIDVLTGGTNKGTYGGRLEVTTSVTNYGDINVNGEFAATKAKGTNYGVITLLEDPYALIQLGANFESIRDGKIVLADPTQYEMFDSYYSQRNDLDEVQGVIEAQINADTYAKVMKNHDTYNGKQQTAWEVLNKIIVTGDLELKADMGNLDKDVVLNGANLKAATKDGFALNTLTIVEGTENSLALAAGVKAATITVKNETPKSNLRTKVNVLGNLTVNEGVTLKINYNAVGGLTDGYMLNIGKNGSLVNKGVIDTEEGDGGFTTDFKGVNRLFTYNEGTLQNLNQICKGGAPKYSGAAYDQLIQLISDLNNGNGKFVGKWAANNEALPRVEKWSGSDQGWQASATNSKWAPDTFGEVRLLELLSEGTFGQHQGYWYIQKQVSGGFYLTMYLGMGKNEPSAEFKALIGELKSNNDKFNVAFNKAVNDVEVPVYTYTWMYVTNYGTLDLTKGQAYGQFDGVNHGTIKGDFSK